MDEPTHEIAAAYLKEAASLIAGDRQDEYGDFFDNCKNAEAESGVDALSCVDVMIAFKNTRLKHSPRHHDSIVDKIAYYALKEVVRVKLLDADERF